MECRAYIDREELGDARFLVEAYDLEVKKTYWLTEERYQEVKANPPHGFKLLVELQPMMKTHSSMTDEQKEVFNEFESALEPLGEAYRKAMDLTKEGGRIDQLKDGAQMVTLGVMLMKRAIAKPTNSFGI